jgi:hypothetical protein
LIERIGGESIFFQSFPEKVVLELGILDASVEFTFESTANIILHGDT